MKRKIIYTTIISLLLYNLLVLSIYSSEAGNVDANIHTISDAYWYSIVTLTTVGYGDFYPVTFWGRTIGFAFVLGSLGILSILLTNISLRVTNYLEKRKHGYFGSNMENHCVIIGWNTFSKGIAEQIINANVKIAVVTDNEADVKSIRELFPKEVCFVLFTELDNYVNLEKANISKSKRVYIGFENDTNILVYTIGLKKIYENVECIVALENIELKPSFNYLGVRYVISKVDIASKFVASYIFEPYVAELTDNLLSTSIEANDMDIQQADVKSEFYGKSYLECFHKFKTEFNIALLGMARGSEIIINPNEMILQSKDSFIFIGDLNAYKNI